MSQSAKGCLCLSLLSFSLPDSTLPLRHGHGHRHTHSHTYIHAHCAYIHTRTQRPSSNSQQRRSTCLFSPDSASFHLLNHILLAALFFHELDGSNITMSRIHDLLQIIDCSESSFSSRAIERVCFGELRHRYDVIAVASQMSVALRVHFIL